MGQKLTTLVVAQPDRAADIYFIRESEHIGKYKIYGPKYKLIFDGIDFFHIGVGKYTIIKVDPGKHLVGVRETGGFEDRKEFDFRPNQKYYFAFTSFSIVNFNETNESNKSVVIRLLSTSEGEAAMKKCTYTPYDPH